MHAKAMKCIYIYEVGDETMIDYTKYRMNQLNSACAEFIRQESAGSLLLMLATIIAMVLANSPMAETYEHALHLFVDLPLLPDMSLLHWVNDGLMAIFFLVVGMEIKREFLFGELKSLSATLLPIAAAVGGMLIPAVLYSLFNMGGPTAQGWAIPMSTDIAFSLGVLAFAAKRVPRSVIVFLTALAIVDDLGGIVVIALFYSTQLHWTALGAGLAVLMLMALFSWRNVHHPLPYVLGGVLTWYAFYQAGIHPTVAGVLTGFLIPAGTENTQHSHPLHLWEHKLSPWSAFLIMPIFALGNAGISMTSESFASLASPIGLGIIAGLFLGKPLGIFTTVFLMVKLGIAKKPEGAKWMHYLGASILAGIGFTMSIFLASLSFSDPAELTSAKAAIVTASILSGLVGSFVFKISEDRKQGNRT